jgi:transposase
MKASVSSQRAPSNPSGHWLISDDLWSELQPLLPPPPKRELAKGGRPRVPERTAMNGIFFVLRTGCRIAIKLAHRRVQLANIIAWSLWRRAHQAQARRAHLKRANLKTKMQL